MRADRLKSIIADVDTEHDPRVQIGLCLMMLPPGPTFRVKQNKDIEATSGVRDEGGRRQAPIPEYSRIPHKHLCLGTLKKINIFGQKFQCRYLGDHK